jgi:hypothetical protein
MSSVDPLSDYKPIKYTKTIREDKSQHDMNQLTSNIRCEIEFTRSDRTTRHRRDGTVKKGLTIEQMKLRELR